MENTLGSTFMISVGSACLITSLSLPIHGPTCQGGDLWSTEQVVWSWNERDKRNLPCVVHIQEKPALCGPYTRETCLVWSIIPASCGYF